VIATKFFIGGHLSRAQLGREIREHLDASLARLGTDHVELYYKHRVPDSFAVEDVAAVMGELIAEGKILGWGQSQATEEQIRRAHAVTPLTSGSRRSWRRSRFTATAPTRTSPSCATSTDPPRASSARSGPGGIPGQSDYGDQWQSASSGLRSGDGI
jgi:Aldo/keto reductase family